MIAVNNLANLPQNGLQKYTIQLENKHSFKKKVFLIKSLRLIQDEMSMILRITNTNEDYIRVPPRDRDKLSIHYKTYYLWLSPEKLIH